MTLRQTHNIMFTGHAFIPVERPGVHVAQVPVGIWERYTIARTEYQTVLRMIKAHFTQEQLNVKEAGDEERLHDPREPRQHQQRLAYASSKSQRPEPDDMS
jgi:hypothetical protein